MHKILVTNDDGIDSDGIKTLAESLSQIGDVTVVAPSTDMTAVSHSLTLYRPLRIEERTKGVIRRERARPGTCQPVAAWGGARGIRPNPEETGLMRNQALARSAPRGAQPTLTTLKERAAR